MASAGWVLLTAMKRTESRGRPAAASADRIRSRTASSLCCIWLLIVLIRLSILERNARVSIDQSLHKSQHQDTSMDIAELLAFSVKNKASDLHLSAGLPPMIRVDGDIRRINVPALDHKEVHALIYDIMNDKQRRDYEEFLETDFSFELPGVARFRVDAFNQNWGAGAVWIGRAHVWTPVTSASRMPSSA